MEKGPDKAGVRTSDVVVTRLARLLSQLNLVWILGGTVLVICVGIYAIAWAMKRH